MVKKLPYFFYTNHTNALRTVILLEKAYPQYRFHILSKEHPFTGRFGWSIYVGHGEKMTHLTYMSPKDLAMVGGALGHV